MDSANIFIENERNWRWRRKTKHAHIKHLLYTADVECVSRSDEVDGKEKKRKKKSLHKFVEENFNLPSSGFASICFLKIGDLFVLSRDKFSGLNLGRANWVQMKAGAECKECWLTVGFPRRLSSDEPQKPLCERFLRTKHASISRHTKHPNRHCRLP